MLFICIQFQPDVTANHLGWIEFRLCARDSRSTPLTHQCLDQHVLADVKGETRFWIGSAKGVLKFQIRLPAGVTCKECVIQWKYNTGECIINILETVKGQSHCSDNENDNDQDAKRTHFIG